MYNCSNGARCDYEEIGESHWQVLEVPNKGTDDLVVKVFGYSKNICRLFTFHLLCVLLVGLPYLFFSWYPQFNILKFKKCSLKSAEVVLVTNNQGQANVLPLQLVYIKTNTEICVRHEDYLRFFVYQQSRYIWIWEQGIFGPLKSPAEDHTLAATLDNVYAIKECNRDQMLKVFGLNSIEVEVKSYWNLFIGEVFNPFYLFQAFSVVLWSLDEYYYYAGCVFFLSFVSIVTSLYQTKKQSLALHNLVESSNATTVTIRIATDGIESDTEVQSSILVPGDILVLPSTGCTMACDAVLLTGSCIVNESMLTGESVPVTKTPPCHSSEMYNSAIHKRHTLFSGTAVIQTRYYGNNAVLAKVVRTGFSTTKGELVKSILFPKPIGFKFYKDSVKFVVFLFCIATLGMAYCVRLYVTRNAGIEIILLRTLDIITIVVPPALPAAMTAGTVYSQARLKRLGIFCISPPRINICGKLKLVCFDKTGTLTEDGLDLYAILPCERSAFTVLVHNPETLPPKGPLMQALACCHSLTTIGGKLNGDPLDLQMFESTKWELIEPGVENTRYDMLTPTVVKPKIANTTERNQNEFEIPYEVGIIRQFQFSSEKQSMSVIARVLGDKNMALFAKGAPEKIYSLCRPETIPGNFGNMLNEYASNGFRIIALAYKKLDRKLKWHDVQRVKRDQIEYDLTFLGLLIMQNSLKPESTPIINDLHLAKIRTVMITGDNIMTAISVSRDCGMVLPQEQIVIISHKPSIRASPKLSFEVVGHSDMVSEESLDHVRLTLSKSKYHFAMDGKTWSVLRHYYMEWIPQIISRGTIYARFGPDQKSQLVVCLQRLDYIVAMCGDGANDCGALKAAHIGISLSQAEASVAAPFTSTVQNISCVKHLALEGRCALVTSFAIFKYMALYSLIQFFTVLILYTKSSTLGNMQFLYIDLVITTSLAVTMGRQGPARVLVSKRPMSSLVAPANVIPLFMQVAACALVQIGALWFLMVQTWFDPLPTWKGSRSPWGVLDEEEEVQCWENSVIFTISCFQYLILATVYSKGKPYRKSFYTNGLLVFIVIILTLFTTFLLVYPWRPIADFFEIVPVTTDPLKNMFRYWLVVFPICHFFISATIESFIADGIWLKKLIHFITRKKHPKNRYKRVYVQMDSCDWVSSFQKCKATVC